MSASTLSELLARGASVHGDRVAVTDGALSLSYAELDAQANRIARILLECGVQVGDRVGLLIDKSLEAVAGIHGVLRAGAGYVPLDPQAPSRRLGYIARDAGLSVLLSSREKAQACPELIENGAELARGGRPRR